MEPLPFFLPADSFIGASLAHDVRCPAVGEPGHVQPDFSQDGVRGSQVDAGDLQPSTTEQPRAKRSHLTILVPTSRTRLGAKRRCSIQSRTRKAAKGAVTQGRCSLHPATAGLGRVTSANETEPLREQSP